MKTLSLLLISLLLFSWPAAAQSPNTAAIVVTVIDQSGAVVPDASVRIVNTATNVRRRRHRNDTGAPRERRLHGRRREERFRDRERAEDRSARG
jgi:hypothetical protein